MKNILLLLSLLLLTSCVQTHHYGDTKNSEVSILKHQESFRIQTINGKDSENSYNFFPFGYHLRSIPPGKHEIIFEFCYCSNGAFLSTQSKKHKISMEFEKGKTYELAYKKPDGNLIFGIVESQQTTKMTSYMGGLKSGKNFIVQINGGSYLGR